MKTGRPPKPAAIKKLEGNPGKRRIKNEVTAESLMSVPEPPARLLPEAKTEWKRLAPALVNLDLLTELDLQAFAELCQNYAYYLGVDKKITDAGTAGVYAMQTTPSGYMQQHPLLSLRRQYYDLWHKGLSDFGLTPAARTRILTDGSKANAPQSTATNDEARMFKLLQGGSS